MASGNPLTASLGTGDNSVESGASPPGNICDVAAEKPGASPPGRFCCAGDLLAPSFGPGDNSVDSGASPPGNCGDTAAAGEPGASSPDDTAAPEEEPGEAQSDSWGGDSFEDLLGP